MDAKTQYTEIPLDTDATYAYTMSNGVTLWSDKPGFKIPPRKLKLDADKIRKAQEEARWIMQQFSK